MLSKNHKDGSVKALDIKARNKAISIMKLRKLADYSNECPLASDATLEISLACLKSSNPSLDISGPSTTDIFLQPITKGHCLFLKHLPNDIRTMLSTGLKYNLTLDSPKLSLTHKMDLPAWFHMGKTADTRAHDHKKTSKCLWSTHNVRTIYDLIILDSQHKLPDHIKSSNLCPCHHCQTAQSNGCTHPHLCLKEAGLILNDLTPKFDPYSKDPYPSNKISDSNNLAAESHAISHPE